jgi:tRNA dimethylallyltransferase
MMPDTLPFNLLTILGPTASGKTRLAVSLAHELSGEIISADSRQVFRGMDIGSGKDLQEYGDVPYHLIDILDPGAEFSVFAFHRHFLDVFTSISAQEKLPILCGGTGLYLDAVLRGYRMVEVPENELLRSELRERSDKELATILKQLKPEQHNTSDLLDRTRTVRAIEIARYEREHGDRHKLLPDIRSLVIGIRWERQELRARITKRLQQRLENGMIEEVQRLHDSGVPWERLDYYGLEYRHLGAFLKGEVSRNDMFRKLNCAIHDFAKRQENWFRKMEKNGVVINWVEGSADPLAEACEIIMRVTSESSIQ